jgi:molecular chaperone GrpE
MSRYYNDPFRPRRPASQRNQAVTLADYQELREAFEKLRAQYERQGTELAEAEQQLEIKNEALQRQTEDLKQLEAELVFARAALQETESEDETATDSGDDDWADRYARLQAEMENLRKRWEQRFASETTEARHRILLDMLPLADHLEMALKHADSQEANAGESFVENIKATQRAFLDTLRRYGVTPVEAKGQPFDPNVHEAVGQIAAADVPEGAVAEVVQTGYEEGERLLRPARVLVSTGSTA